MDVNIEIDKLITEINNHSEYTELYEDDFYNETMDSETSYKNYVDYKATIQVAKDEKLITGSFTFNRKLKLTPFGKSIIKKGGWLKHLEAESNKAKREAEKDDFDFKTKKWVYKTRFLPLLFSGVALIISTCSYLDKDKEAIRSSELKTEIENIKKTIKSENNKKDLIQNNVSDKHPNG